MLRAARSAEIESLGLSEQLLSGGDSRLALDPVSGLNVYGCSVRPRRSDGGDFSSSTASTISERAYMRLEHAWRRVSRFKQPALFEGLVEESRCELKTYLGLADDEADVIFSPSGTDAQLIALFLARALRGRHMVSVIVGSDQTGSGTAYTARGECFSDRGTVRKGDPISGLADQVSNISIPFCDASGLPRSLAEMDRDVLAAVEAHVSKDCAVLLQVMASSKLGWAAPSAACIDVIRERWPDKVQLVTDSCQMRIGADRLRHILARGDLVLMTGSKFLCGPPFSGAVLVPKSLRTRVAMIDQIPQGLSVMSRESDWPSCWPRLQKAFQSDPNIGQWLRWQAALEEMRAYHAVPVFFREVALHYFAMAIPALLGAADGMKILPQAISDPDPERDGEFAVPTIFSFLPQTSGRGLSFAECRDVYRRLGQDAASDFPGLDVVQKQIARQRCHIGQPVAIGADGAVLRLSSSARLVAECWSPDPAIRTARLQAEMAKAEVTIQKCMMILRRKALDAA